MSKPILWVGSMLALSTLVISGNAATISISNLTDGAPVVTTDLVGATITTSFEQAVVSATLVLAAGTAVAPGTRSVILLEPASDPFGPRASDFATLTVSEIQQGPAGVFQTLNLLFQSDGAVGFDRNIAALPSNTPSLTETGASQDVSSQLNSGLLVVQLASDLAGSEPAEPGTWMLLVTGLLAAFLYRRFKREAR